MGKKTRKEYQKLYLVITVCGLLTVFLGLSAILGWLFDIPLLASFDSSKIPMALSTAVLFTVYGLIIPFFHRLQSSKIALRLAIIFSFLGIFLVLFIFYLSISGIRLHAEHLMIILSAEVDGIVVGHMSPITAFCFVLTGLSFLLNLVLNDQKKLSSFVLIIPGLLFFISTILLLSYLFGTPLLYEGNFIPPALPTSLAFLFLGVALLLISGVRVWDYEELADALNTRLSFILVLIFTVLMGSIITVGYSFYKGYEKHYRFEIEHQLSSIADLKVSELVQWRKERLGDASIFYQNPNFSSLVKNYFREPNDLALEKRIRIWMSHVHTAYNYNRVCLHDTDGKEWLFFPNRSGPHASTFYKNILKVIKSGQVHFEDFYLNEFDKQIYMNISIPILDPGETNKVIGVLALRIDPEQYLYPLINKWPTPSKTAETLIIRREGQEVVFLNELRFKKNTALNLRSPVTEISLPAVQAGLGKNGIFEGVDYRGVPVIAFVCPIPNSPWALVARMDVSEIFAPLRERLWMLVFVVFLLMAGTSSVIWMVWRNQRMNFYKERYQSSEKIRKLNRVYAILSDINQAIVRTREPNKLFNQACEIAIEKGGFLLAWIGKINLTTNFVEVVASAGIKKDEYIGKINLDLMEQNLNPTLSATALKYGHHVISNDCQNDVNFLAWQTDFKKYGYKSIVSLPLLVNGRNWGIFSLYSGDLDFFDDEEIKLLDELAMDISFAVEFAEKEADRKKAKEALTNSETRYRSLFESAKDGILILDEETGKIVDVNPFLIELLGYSKENFIEKEIWEIGFFKDIVANYDKFIELQQKKYVRNEDLPLETADGRKINVEFVSNVYSVDHHDVIQCNIRDITIRKRAEESLRESELRFRQILESANEWIWEVDINGLYTFVSPTIKELLGYEAIELIGIKHFYDFFDPENKEEMKHTALAAMVRKEILREFINCNIHKDGRKIILSTTGFPIFDREKNLIGYRGADVDITEKIKAEEKLKLSERNFNEAERIADTGSWEYDVASDTATWSQNMFRIFDVDPETPKALVFKYFVEHVVHPEDRTHILSVFNDAISGKGEYDVEYRIVKHDNSIRFIHALAETLRDQNNSAFKMVGWVQDITERKQSEDELRKREAYLSAIIENQPGLVWLKNTDGRFLAVNNTFVLSCGKHTAADVVGKTDKDIWSPELAEKYQSDDNHVMQSGNPISVEELIIDRGEEKWFDTFKTPVVDLDGKIIGTTGFAKDISERKRAEEMLRESELRFRSVWEKSTDGMRITNEEGIVVLVNDAYSKIVEKPREEIEGKPLSIVYEKAKQAEVLRKHQERFCSRSIPAHLERELVLWNGKKTFLELSNTFLENPNQPTLSLSLFKDISERKRAEKEIAMLAHSLKSINECVSITDVNDNIVFVNESFLKTYGYSESELVGKSIDILRPKNNPPELVKEILPATLQGGWKGELLNKRKDGGVFPISLSTTVINDKEGKPLGLIGVATDITERKRAEKELTESEERFRAVSEYSFNSICIVNESGKIIWANEAMCKMGGYSIEQIYAEESFIKFIAPQSVEFVVSNFIKFARDEEYEHHYEFYIVRADGQQRLCEKFMTHFQNAKGSRDLVISMMDITERKEMLNELISAKEKAEESYKLKTEFLAQMSHEIRTPLNAIISFANILKEELVEKITSEHKEYFDGIDSAGHRLIRTVDMILNSSELQVGAYEPIFTEFGLIGEVITRIRNDYSVRIKEKGLEYNFSSNIKEAVIRGDKYTIYQLFVNLIDNAVKYTKKGYISVKVEKNEKFIEVTVEDTGIGISEEFMAKMYMPFVQEERGYSRRYEGNGLGLSLVKRYCELNGISIEVVSKKGDGTKFILTFTNSK